MHDCRKDKGGALGLGEIYQVRGHVNEIIASALDSGLPAFALVG